MATECSDITEAELMERKLVLSLMQDDKAAAEVQQACNNLMWTHQPQVEHWSYTLWLEETHADRVTVIANQELEAI